MTDEDMEAAVTAVADPAPEAELEKLVTAAREAKLAHDLLREQIESEQREARYAAERAVTEKYEEQRKALYKARLAAEIARDNYISAITRHPLEGRHVSRVRKGRYSWKPDRTERGIIKVRRVDTEIPYETSSWKRPDIGQAYVQRVKVDGTEGQIDCRVHGDDEASFSANSGFTKWNLEPVSE